MMALPVQPQGLYWESHRANSGATASLYPGHLTHPPKNHTLPTTHLTLLITSFFTRTTTTFLTSHSPLKPTTTSALYSHPHRTMSTCNSTLRHFLVDVSHFLHKVIYPIYTNICMKLHCIL